jgi:protein tyrosine phosphatase
LFVALAGTFCAIFSVLNSLPAIVNGDVKRIDVQGLVREMRRARRFMVQTIEQFVFTYRTVLHSATE